VNRVVILSGEITGEIVARVAAELAQLELQSREAISLLIDSPGGDTKPARELADLIKKLTSPVHATVTRQALSAGFIVLQACTRRMAGENASLMFHPPGFTAEEASAISAFPCDEDVRFDDDEQYLEWLGYLSQRSGAPLELLASWGREEKEFNVGEALQHGFIDEVVPARESSS
jgi:ATP-dependent protease ClpP protease subunit